MTDNVEARNVLALARTLIDVNARVYAQQARIDGLNDAVATLVGRVAQLESTVLRLRAVSAGHGPTG